MTNSPHYSVLLKESIDALVLNPSGVYVDGTFGRGGHSRAILAQLSPSGRLIAFDKDPDAIAIGQQLEKEDKRFSIVHGSFAELSSLKGGDDGQPGIGGIEGVTSIDGLTLDLGVSSPQLDVAERGFSFLKDGPLDMRMNNAEGPTAAQWLAKAEQSEIAFALKEYGEERFAKRIAGAIVKHREDAPIETTLRLASIVKDANPNWEKGKHPATRAFQGIRIYINKELDDLKQALEDAIEMLSPGGRMVVISFHSLEDRLVKRFFRDLSQGKKFPPGIPVTESMLDKKLKTIGKMTKATDEELEENIRSRSAVMRIAERL